MTIKALVINASITLALTLGSATVQAQETQPVDQDAQASSQSTLERVRARGTLICGASNNSPGFAEQDENNRWFGFDVDFCRALAATIFNDSSRVEFRALPGDARYVDLQSGEIDVLARTANWTMTRDLGSKIHYVGTSFFDGQSFLVPNNNDSVSVLDLDGRPICVQDNSENQQRLRRFFLDNNIALNEHAYEDAMDLPAAYEAGMCSVISANLIEIQRFRLSMEDPASHKLLPEIISNDLFGPVVRNDDDNWGNIVRWTLFSLINAEELGVSAANVGTMVESRTPAIRRLLGIEGDLATNLGLENGWALNMIEQVGNYGEMFDRNLGGSSTIGMQRGLNALWTQGGLLYAPPVR